MKENIKISLFGISIFYSLIVIILMIFSLMNSVDKIDFGDEYDDNGRLDEYKKEILLLENNSCTNTISEIIKYYEDTSYIGEVRIKDIYDYSLEKGIISFYIDVRDNCNINDEIVEEYDLSRKFLTATIQSDELFQRYYFQYEIGIKNISIRDIFEPTLSNIEYNIKKGMELEIIDDLINIVNQHEVNINE